MRSTFTLAVVFLAFAAFPLFGVPGGKPSSIGYALVALLVVAGLAVLTTKPLAFYLGLVAASATALVGILGLANVPIARGSLPVNPTVTVVIGLYLCFRLALAYRTFFAPVRSRGVLSDELPPE